MEAHLARPGIIERKPVVVGGGDVGFCQSDRNAEGFQGDLSEEPQRAIEGHWILHSTEDSGGRKEDVRGSWKLEGQE